MNCSIFSRIAARLRRKADTEPPVPPVPPVPPPGDSTDEWGVNDLAECIVPYGDWICRRTGIVLKGGGPQFGHTYRVAHIDVVGDATGLVFAHWPKCAFNALAFRKITPRADEQTAGTCTTIKDLLRLPAQPAEAA